jgi:general secretion pathway protein G
MVWASSERRSFFPWERRGGLFRRLGLYRLGPLAFVLCLIGLLALIVVRERRQSGIRRTRALLLDVRQVVDAYLADHKGQCPPTFSALSDYGVFKSTPMDAWGRPLTLICPGSEPGEAYRLISAGPDGIAGGLDRIE